MEDQLSSCGMTASLIAGRLGLNVVSTRGPGAVPGPGLAPVQVAYDRAAGVAVLMGAIDTLGKGTASAAVQCLNLALGLGETTGVVTEGVAP